MDKIDYIENWLSTVCYSHSDSKQTKAMYATHLHRFLEFIGKTPEQIAKEYERLSERKFRHVYTQYVMSFITELRKQPYAPSTPTTITNGIKSYFKYNDLPLGFIPAGSTITEFHNRDIAHSEVLEILKVSTPREKPFYTLIAQSGLRPDTLCKLRLGDVEGILDENTPVPCKITVQRKKAKGKYSEHFTFCGTESVQYLKAYLKTRTEPLTADSYLFTKQGLELPCSAGTFSHIFLTTVLRLRENGVLSFKVEEKQLEVKDKSHKLLRDHISRSELRLYCLRKFFRKYANQMGFEHVNFLMGHKTKGSDPHYVPQDPEWYRKLYETQAMPHLRLETSTPSEADQQISELREENKKLKEEIAELSGLKGRVANVEETTRELNKLLKQQWGSLTESTFDVMLKKIKEAEEAAQKREKEA